MLIKKSLKIIAITIFLLLLASVATSAYAPIKLIINGGQTKVSPRIINGCIYAPIRSIAENLGATVAWDKKENTVNITSNHGISNEYIYNLPLQLKGGELSLGTIEKYDSSFVLPVLVTINKYLAEKQLNSLTDNNKTVLTRYELLESAFTTGGAFWQEDTAYEVGVRLYYSKFTSNTSPGVIKLIEEKNANATISYSADRPAAEKSWYEDTVFIVRPVGNTARVIEENESGSKYSRKIWIQGENNWYVDESATEVLKKVDLKEIPMPFDIPLPN